MFGLTTTRRLNVELAAAKAETDRQRRRAEKASKAQETAETNRAQILRQNADLDEKYADVCIVNECLTEDLRKARERIAQYGVRRTVSDVLEEHDVHRKALADALGDQKRHLNWEQLIGEVSRLQGAAEAWMADHATEKKRADGLQARLDDAVGLTPAGIRDSAPWQPGYQQPKPDKEATTS
jgi:chromosome segregation ATPase